MKRIAAAILRRNDKILICRRGPGGSCGYLWEFPGGKIEPGETGEDCAVRECREELGVEISPDMKDVDVSQGCGRRLCMNIPTGCTALRFTTG